MYFDVLTAQRDILNNEMKRGVLSQPEIQCINIPPSPEQIRGNSWKPKI